MTKVEHAGRAEACEHCEMAAGSLYGLPPERRLADRFATRVCFFCYLRLAGTDPRRTAVGARRAAARSRE